MAARRESLIGLSFGSWIVKKAGRRSSKNALWLCVCACGVEREVRADHLKNGRSKSCRGPLCSKQAGLSSTRTYRSWTAMQERCYNPLNKSYTNYGARGITVCSEWANSFAAFYEDMGERPPFMSLGRINNDEGYSKQNCRWETRTQQNRNTRKTLRIKWHGQLRLLIEICEEISFPYSVARGRLSNGWSLDQAFNVPIKPKKPNRSKDEIKLEQFWRRLVRAAGSWIEPRAVEESVLEQSHS